MADSPIGALQSATVLNDEDLLVLEQNGTAKNLSGATLKSFVDRDIVSMQVYERDVNTSPEVNYDRITGVMRLGIPKTNGIAEALIDQNYNLVLVMDSGDRITVGTVQGETGKSAYDYAREHGYTGTETEYAQLMVDLYNASLNEQQRVQAEQERNEQYTEIYNNTLERLERFDKLMEYADSKVVQTTLILYRAGINVFDTTLML